MGWLDRIAGPGDHGIWTLPDGRKLFYPHGFGRFGYLVPDGAHEHRIRSRFRWLAALTWLPAAIAFATDDWRVIVAYVAIAGAAQYLVTRLWVRGLERVREPMGPLRGLAVAASSYPRGYIVVAFAVCFLLTAVVLARAIAGDVSIGFGAGAVAFFGLLAFAWGYMGFAKAD